MIDIKDLRENPQKYQQSIKSRGLKVDLDEFLAIDQQYLEFIPQIEDLRSQLNLKSKPSAAELKALKKVKSDYEKLSVKFETVERRHRELLEQIPNLVAEGTPEGGEEANREERAWGKKPSLPNATDHLELGQLNDWIDFERGAKVAGAKFYYLKGGAVKLERALMRMLADLLEREGFTFLGVPHLVTERIAAGTGFLPRGEERQTYQTDDGLYLIATAEMPLTGYHADETLELTEPLLYAAESPSYRLEAGAYGKYSKGLYRVHQFAKLEMYIYCRPEDSEKLHQKLLDLEEAICRKLDIPYRVVRIAAGDLGAPAYKKYDVEYWSPVEGEYRELMSCSNCTDYQARRLGIKYKDGQGKSQFAYTLNGTAAAFSRIFIALLENHQTAQGQVKLPKALQKYYGGKTL